MTTCVALLKGINVGGRHSVPMAELRGLLESLGYTSPDTYIQSGNAVFEASAGSTGDDNAVAQRVGDTMAVALAERFGFAIPVVVRTAAQLADVLARVPTPPTRDPKQVHVLFLGGRPTAAEWGRIDIARADGDPVMFGVDELFVDYRNGAGRSRFTGDYIERMLGVTVTARNLNTVVELHRRAAARDT